MSRLAGRVTFPGASQPAADCQPAHSDRPEAQDDRRGGNTRNERPTQYRNQDRTHQDRTQYRTQERTQDEVRPRGKGNVRYQGNYSDRFSQHDDRTEFQPKNQRYQDDRRENQYSQRGGQRYQDRSDRSDRYQKSQGSDRADRYQNSERPPRFDRSDRSPAEQGHQESGRVERQQRQQRLPRSDRSQGSDRSSQSPPAETRQVNRKPTQKVEDVMPSEELLEVEDLIAQISDLNIRSDRSAVQIKRNILSSNDLIDTMEEDDWEQVCESMLATALEQGEPEFIADLVVALFKNNIFAAVMSDELMTASSAHVMEDDGKPLPGLLAAILCAHWPRQYAKAFDNVNPILYTVVCIVKGWVEVVSEDTEHFHKVEKKPKYQGREEEDTPEPEEEKEKIVEEPALVNKCAVALSDLCDSAQRQLWVNWMQVTDEIYQCIKPAITHNQNIEGDVKARLLDTFMQMNVWTKTRQAGVKHAGVQTVSEGC